jgi:hypothetical protein
MTTHTWIEVGGGLVLGILAVHSFFKMRAMRAQMTRQLLFPFIGQLVSWLIVGGFFSTSSGDLLSVCYFTAVAVIYIPPIIWILRLPKDDHVA